MRLDSIVLMCRDVEASRAWYQTAGFPLVRSERGMHWFSCGDVPLLLHPAEVVDDRRAIKLAVAVDDVRALFDTFARAGLAPFDHQQPGGTIDGPVTREWGDLTFDAHDLDGHEWSFVQR